MFNKSHNYIATVLNNMEYKGRKDHNSFSVYIMTMKGSYVSWAFVVRTFKTWIIVIAAFIGLAYMANMEMPGGLNAFDQGNNYYGAHAQDIHVQRRHMGNANNYNPQISVANVQADRDEILRCLPTFSFNKEQYANIENAEEKLSCCICMDEFEDN